MEFLLVVVIVVVVIEIVIVVGGGVRLYLGRGINDSVQPYHVSKAATAMGAIPITCKTLTRF